MRLLIFIFLLLLSSFCVSYAQSSQLFGTNDPMVQAQEKLLRAKGSYETVKQQERAIKDLKKATKLSLKASKLRAKAEKIQAKADALQNKATQNALTRGLYISNPNSSNQPPADALQRSAEAAPIPGNPINIFVPKQETVSYDQNGSLPEPPVPEF